MGAMSRAEKAGAKKMSGCGGCKMTCADEGNPCVDNVAVSLGIGIFRFKYKETEFKALHQHVGDPVGTGCGPSVLSNLVIFKEGVGAGAAQAVRSFLSEILAESEKSAKNTFQVYRWHIKYGFWQRVSRVVARPVSSVILPAETSDMIVNDMAEFLSEETSDFYQQHGIPYKRSYLFYGVPGAGKTSMLQALAGRFGRNLCYLSPTHPELDDDSLKSAIERVPENAVVILEDVDALFGKGREKKIHNSPLTFSGLLNALDGVGNHSGVIFILTTNFKDQLDAALIRDGRVDIRVKFDYCTAEQIEKMFEVYFPVAGHVPAASNSTEAGEDPEIAALEARLAALKKAKAAGTKSHEAAGEQITGAVFRDALLLALGERKVTAAQLQSFFVKQRKASAKEALGAVDAFVTSLEEREKENASDAAAKEAVAKAAGDEGKQPAKKPSKNRTQPEGKPAAGEPATACSGGTGSSGSQAVHVHIHTGPQ